MDNFHHNAQNVIAMSQYTPQTGFSALAQIEAYWQALRGDRTLPKRSEIDPRGIEAVLEYAFIVERIAPGIARLRVAGSHLNDVMGMEVRGMPLSSFFMPPVRRRVNDLLEEVFETPATCVLHLEATTGAVQTKQSARMNLLPLRSDLGDVSRILGCLVVPSMIETPPLRFDITDVHLRSLTPHLRAADPVKPIVRNFEHPKHAQLGFAEPKKQFERPSTFERPPYLRLVDSDE